MTDMGLVWDVPAEQTMTFRIAPGTSGLLDAESLGRQITALCRLWIIAANTHSKMKWKTVLLSVKTDRKGGVTCKVALAPKKSEVDKLKVRPTTPPDPATGPDGDER